MTLTVDDKGRLTCRKLFPPHASFDAELDNGGRIVLTRLAKEERPPKMVKPVRYKGLLIMPGEVDVEKLAQKITEETQKRDALLLG